MGWRLRDAIRRTSSTFSRKESKAAPKARSSPAQQARESGLPASAALAVLKTPELLELVLVNLDQEALLRAQRVCRHWRDVIGSSLPLQRKLYLAPTTEIDERIPIDNAWLKSRFPDFGLYLLRGNPRWRFKFVKALAMEDFDRLGPGFFREPNASWRSMLLTQPPLKEVVVFSNIDDASTPSPTPKKRNRHHQLEEQRQPSVPSMEELIKASVTVKSSTGVTMGMIVDAGIEARKRGSAAAKRRMSDRKDSGYISLDEAGTDEIEVSVVEIVD